MSEWQPIETAPRDGTEILGYDADMSCSIFVCARSGEGWWIGNEYAVEPTHWQPLPAPPAFVKES